MKDANYYADLYNAYDKNPKKIRVLDSTLREGEQHPGVSFTNKQRIQIINVNLFTTIALTQQFCLFLAH